MIARGTPMEILSSIMHEHPDAAQALETARKHVPRLKREIDEFQAAALFVLAQKYNFHGANILEIGTAWGYSAAVMSLAAPQASIVTLNPREDEVVMARAHLAAFKNVTIRVERSWDYLTRQINPSWDMVFVDGDHKNLRLDLPWWAFVKPMGLMLYHDYSPEDSRRRCEVVYHILNDYRNELGRDFDVSIIDDSKVGMVGYYKEA